MTLLAAIVADLLAGIAVVVFLAAVSAGLAVGASVTTLPLVLVFAIVSKITLPFACPVSAFLLALTAASALTLKV